VGFPLLVKAPVMGIYTDFASDPQHVLTQARALDQIPQDERGPLHGVAVAIKDAFTTKGIF
jgi:Asp-tRNA(Asn)/Glu-tRNA(Gln) amidotransferase A subunit family amidase